MKKAGLVWAVILTLGALLLPLNASFAATDGHYLLSQVATAWDGTDASRTKAANADYDYGYGDEGSLTYPLPWSFSFYGVTYSQIVIDANGYIRFSSTSGNSFNLANTGLGPVIAPWNNDLSSYYYGGFFVQHKTDPERVVIEWQTETYTEEGLYRPNNFETIIYLDGAVRFDYRNFDTHTGKDFGSGISKGDGTTLLGLTANFGNTFTQQNTSFQFQLLTPLTVDKDGTGSGTVTSLPAGISCGSACSSSFGAGTSVNLTATPETNSTFTGWSGACTGIGACTVTMDSAKNVMATFSLLPPTVSITSPSGIIKNNCPLLQYSVSSGTAVVKVDNVIVPKVSGDYLDTLLDGPHTVQVEATNAGGTGSADSSIVVDTAGMPLTISVSTIGITADYQGNIGISINYLSASGNEVFIEQFVDANRNNIIDTGDYVIRSFKVSDGAASTNLNVQGDEDGTANSSISTTLNYFMQNDLYHAPGHYIFRASMGGQTATAIFIVSPILQPQTISGTVTDGTNPLAGAMVRLVDKWRRHQAFAVSDEYGKYSLTPKNSGQFYAIPYAYGYAARNDMSLTTVASGQTISGHNITLLKGVNHLYGRLTNTAGSSGIDGLWVVGHSADYTGIAISDSNGNYDLKLPAGQYDIRALLDLDAPNPSTKGYLGIQRGVDGVTLPGITGRVEFKLPLPDVFVTGKVTDSAGNPLGGVPIEGREQKYDLNGRTSESKDPRGGTVSDSDGNYSLGLRPADTWGMVIGIARDYDGYIGPFKYPFYPLPSTLSGNNIVAQKVTAWIEGSLKNRDDLPIKDAEIKVQGVIDGVSSRILTNRTTNDGTFRVGIIAGSWDLTFLSSPDVIINDVLQSVTVTDGESKTLNVAVDSRLPLVMLNPLPSATNKTVETLSGVRGEGVTVMVDGGSPYNQFMADYPTTTTWSGSFEMAQQEGIDTITVYGVGTNGLYDSIINSIYIDRSRPTVTMISPVANTTYPYAPSIEFSVSDQNPVTVVVKVDGKVVQNYSGDTLSLSDGNHTVLVEATDIAGNTGFSSIGFTVGTAPVQNNVTEKFETGEFSLLPWVLSGDGMWSVVAGGGYNQTKGAVSPASLRDGESAALVITYNCVTSGSIGFKYGIDLPLNKYQKPFSFYIDDVERISTDGFIVSSFMHFPINPGTHKIKWLYAKQYSEGFTGKNAVWLDDILFACNNPKKTR